VYQAELYQWCRVDAFKSIVERLLQKSSIFLIYMLKEMTMRNMYFMEMP